MTIEDLSDEQKEFIEKAKQGKNLLVDACIGSGKTTSIQVLCNEMPSSRSILYLTYNRLLKIDAQEKIVVPNAFVTNYHGYAWRMLKSINISAGQSDLIQTYLKHKPKVWDFDLLIIDEYQDIEQELAEMLEIIKEQNPNIQIIAVGDMQQKIYDKTTLDVPSFIEKYLEDYELLNFTKCFRLGKELAGTLGNIWNKTIDGCNEECTVSFLDFDDAVDFLAHQDLSEILCLGARTGAMPRALNMLETEYPEKFNKKTVYATIRPDDRGSTVVPDKNIAIFTTYDSSKGLERNVCLVFNFTEDYWYLRAFKSLTKYDILRNIFCVAASRGKRHIIFVKEKDYTTQKYKKMLTEKVLSTYIKENLDFKKPFNMSEMFSFKYKEDVEKCFGLIKKKKKRRADKSVISIKSNDDLIDLSPCIGIYQEACYFSKYDIDNEIKFAQNMHRDKPCIRLKKNADLNEKILCLTAFITSYARYTTQIKPPFVSSEQEKEITDRLSTEFSKDEEVQRECNLDFITDNNQLCKIRGRADVIKNNNVYELKFVSELNHEHFLQCACYVVAMGLKKGFLWNVQNNEMYEITVPDRKKFLDAVVSTITKGVVKKFND